MVADLDAARGICDILPVEEELLRSARRPIVLLRRKAGGAVARAVAAGNPSLGVMLPYSPLHHLLVRETAGAPLVMTSGNRSDEPIAFQDDEAIKRLAGIADFFLTNDRPIHIRCDDSVTRHVAGGELPLRRSRGYAPQPVRMPVECRMPTLALGGQMKATFALGRGHHALLSHHIGDLDHYEASRSLAEAIAHYQRLFDVTPGLLVHDLHPDYATTRYARLEARSRTTMAVQHHHAHMASCMAENGVQEPVIGVTFDGTGYGLDGTIWGGEFLIGDYATFRRAGHLRAWRMPGGERAVHEPWRLALAFLIDAGIDPQGTPSAGTLQERATIARMLERGFNSPLTSSAGRLFDAIASLAGVRQQVAYEGQAAIELEWLASEASPDGSYPFDVVEGSEGSGQTGTIVFDMRPIARWVSDEVRDGVSSAVIARRFHSTMVEVIARGCVALRRSWGLDAVVLSGGVFMNALLTTETVSRLNDEGFRVFRHKLVPPNDGGLCLGQLAIAAARQNN
jgi:hydrogenase maturation protein HypF